jgi:hypothetical protein
MARPLLFLDVDGVLALQDVAPAGYVEHEVCFTAGTTEVKWLNPEHGPWVNALAHHFDIVWATGWEHHAPRLLAPLLDLPELPVLELTQRPPFGPRIAKLRDVAARAGERPAAWIDDDFEEEVWPWAERRPWPTLLVETMATRGLERGHVDTLLRFARDEGPAQG